MRRLECLDGLRGGLAAYVMISHLAPFAVLPAWAERFFAHGGAAVDVFFVLSGMVIFRSWEGFAGRAGPFLLARAARTLPIFFVTFALAVAVQPLPSGFPLMPWIGPDSPARSIWSSGWPEEWVVELLAHLTMTHGLFPSGVLPGVWVSFLGAAWSLSTEWQFYALVACIAPRLGRGKSGPATLAALFLVLSAAAILWDLTAPPGWRFSRAFLPNKAQYFALGIASARLASEPVSLGLRAFAPVLAVSLALTAAQGGFDKLAAPLVWTVCLAAEVSTRGSALGAMRAALRAAPLQWLGGLSYCIYLVNEPVQKLVGLALAMGVGPHGALFTVLWLPAAAVLPLALARWLHVQVEMPALRWGRDLARRLDCAASGFAANAFSDGRSASRAGFAPRAAPWLRSASRASPAGARASGRMP